MDAIGHIFLKLGLGISKTKLMYFNIDDFPIKGIVCSTNDVGVK